MIKEISSGAKNGNCHIVDNIIMVDCGVSFKKICEKIGSDFTSKLKHIFITHDHYDHINSTTLLKILKSNNSIKLWIPDFCVENVANMLLSENFGSYDNNLISIYENIRVVSELVSYPNKVTQMDIDGIKVLPNKNNHGNYYSYGYTFTIKDKNYMIQTDLSDISSIPTHIEIDQLFIECNHCEDIEKIYREENEKASGVKSDYVKSHLSSTEATLICSILNPKKVKFIHLGDTFVIQV